MIWAIIQGGVIYDAMAGITTLYLTKNFMQISITINKRK
jgi:hypothetical protein